MPLQPGRMFKGAADKARQKRMEGKKTPFQRALRRAETTGKSKFSYEGKSYASKPKRQPTTTGKGPVPPSRKINTPSMKKVSPPVSSGAPQETKSKVSHKTKRAIKKAKANNSSFGTSKEYSGRKNVRGKGFHR